MQPVQHNGFLVTIPRPLMLVVEDVGWWEGQDGSSVNEPFRSGMDRNHCLEDYQALLQLARSLKMRIQISMVLCEWDRSDLLRRVPTATWMGETWRNPMRRQETLEEAADFLRTNSDYLEIGLHGVGHEFWKNETMERSEFHDPDNIMRSPGVIRQHLDAFGDIMEENGLGPFPRAFVPPALHHSFGNGDQSLQAILRDYGITCETTIFSRAYQHASPAHKEITWENDVLLIERHQAPVPWHIQAAAPVLLHEGPVVGLHWKNLLHLDPHRNGEVVNPWGEYLSACCADFEQMAAADTTTCWSQFAYHSLTKIKPEGAGVEIDVSHVPYLSAISPCIFLKIRDEGNRCWKTNNGKIALVERSGAVSLFRVEGFSRSRPLYLIPQSSETSQ